MATSFQRFAARVDHGPVENRRKPRGTLAAGVDRALPLGVADDRERPAACTAM